MLLLFATTLVALTRRASRRVARASGFTTRCASRPRTRHTSVFPDRPRRAPSPRASGEVRVAFALASASALSTSVSGSGDFRFTPPPASPPATSGSPAGTPAGASAGGTGSGRTGGSFPSSAVSNARGSVCGVASSFAGLSPAFPVSPAWCVSSVSPRALHLPHLLNLLQAQIRPGEPRLGQGARRPRGGAAPRQLAKHRVERVRRPGASQRPEKRGDARRRRGALLLVSGRGSVAVRRGVRRGLRVGVGGGPGRLTRRAPRLSLQLLRESRGELPQLLVLEPQLHV
jgi:hypothetical protein